MEHTTTIVVSLIGLIGILIPAYWGYKTQQISKEKDNEISRLKASLLELQDQLTENDLRTEIVERLLDITLLSEIRDAVDNIFEETRADRFLILIAMNGTLDFRMVSVIFEQHKSGQKINAIARYRNLTIDSSYCEMLKKAEKNGIVELDVEQMPEDSLLKTIYEIEGVNHSNVRFLLRKTIDEDNDVVVFSSVATHSPEPFTLHDKAVCLSYYDSTIIPSLRMMTNPL